MDIEIIVALIGAAGVIIAAVIGAVAKSKGADKKVTIKQKAKGENSVQIGVQHNCATKEGKDDG